MYDFIGDLKNENHGKFMGYFMEYTFMVVFNMVLWWSNDGSMGKPTILWNIMGYS